MALSEGEQFPPPTYVPATLVDLLQHTAKEVPNQGIYYLNPDYSHTHQSYQELLEVGKRICFGLQQSGLKPQDKVIFQFNLAQHFISALWACLLGGFVPVPLSVSPTYEPSQNAVKKLINAWQNLARPLILTSESLMTQIRPLFPLWAHKIKTLESLLDAPPDSRIYNNRPEDLALLLLTSGSTGLPKGIPLTHQHLVSNLVSSAYHNHLTREDISLNWLNLDHVGSLVRCCLRDSYVGNQQIHVPTEMFLSNPIHWLDWIERYRVTFAWAPNFAFALINEYAQLIHQKHWDLSCLKSLLSVAEPIVPQTAKRFYELLAPHGLRREAMHSAWGMSETASAVVFSHQYLLKTSERSSIVEVGQPVPGLSVRIVDPQGDVIQEDIIGQIQIKGPMVFSGYYKNPRLTQENFTPEGWFKTGDLGFLHEGYLTITGRQRDIIIIRGLSYAHHEIEAIVESVKGVEASYTAACAFRRPESNTDELLIFFHPSKEIPLGNLLKDIYTQLTQKIGITPRYLVPVDKSEIPKSSIGKILHHQLKERFQQGAFLAQLRQADILLGNDHTILDGFYRKTWQPQAIRGTLPQPSVGQCLIFADTLGLGEHLFTQLSSQQVCIRVLCGSEWGQRGEHLYQINPQCEQDYWQLLQAVVTPQHPISHILHLWTYQDYIQERPDGQFIERAQHESINSLLYLIRALLHVQGSEHFVQLHFVSNHTHKVLPQDQLACEKSPVLGIIKTLPREHAGLNCVHLDFSGVDLVHHAALILQEYHTFSKEREVAYRHGQRFVARLEKVDMTHAPPHPLPFKSQGRYLLSGGLGGIGINIARYLLQHYSAHLLLIGRTSLPERALWQDILQKNGPESQKISAYLELASLGGEIIYESVDVCDLPKLQTLIAHHAWSLDGIIHLAGVVEERLFIEETPERLAEILRPKTLGTWTLHQLIKDQAQAVFISFSSVLSFFGGATIGAYAAANQFLESFFHYQQDQTSLQSYCLSSSTWENIGMNQGSQGRDSRRIQGHHAMSVEQGMNSFLASLHGGPAHLFMGLEENAIQRYLERPAQNRQTLTAYVVFPPSVSLETSLEVYDLFHTQSTCQIQALPSFPRTPTGEIDRHALLTQDQHLAPRNNLEQQLVTVWEEVLGIHPIGIRDNFFELGGHSLLVTRLIARIEKIYGQRLPLLVVFQTPTIEQLAQHLHSATIKPTQTIFPRPSSDQAPLSFAQQRLWFLEQLQPSGALYHIAKAFKIKGPLQKERLKTALDHIIARHEILRTTLSLLDGQPTQTVASSVDLALPVYALSQDELAPWLEQEIQRPFDLSQDIPLRTTLFRLNPDEHLFLLVIHHLASDGWSSSILFRELSQWYEALGQDHPSPLAELTIQYADFAVWQRQEFKGEFLDKQLEYWKTQLKGAPTQLYLPTDAPRSTVQSFSGNHQYFHISSPLTDSLKQLSQANESTLFMLLLATFVILLGRYSGQEEVVVGSPIANRTHHELEGLIGFFVNMLVLRFNLAGNPPFEDFLAHVKQVCLQAYAHQDMPFEKLVEVLTPERRLNHSPLFQVLFVLQNVPTAELQLTELEVVPVEMDLKTAQFDLTLALKEAPSGLMGNIEYSTDLFQEATITRLIGHFQTLLEAIVIHPQQKIYTLPLLMSQEREQLLKTWNATTTHYPSQSIHELFEEQVQRTPQALAVRLGEQQLSYQELNHRANQLAHYLKTQTSFSPQALVGVCLDRCIEIVIALLGILKAGGAYVPLESSYPQERLHYMLQETVFLLTQQQWLDRFPQALPKLCLDSQWELIAQEHTENLSEEIPGEHLAYVLYTSGSTGMPKGVKVPHRAVCNHLWWMQSNFPLTSEDSILQKTPIHFDPSVWELFAPLMVGGQLVLAQNLQDPHHLASTISDYHITNLQIVPCLLQALLEQSESLCSLKRIFCGGEVLSGTLVQRCLEKLAVELINVYGPTETCINSTFFTCSLHPNTPNPPIGRPIANTQIYLLDVFLQPVPIGVYGELYISGKGLAKGYLNLPQTDAEKFVSNPFDSNNPVMYKTGDLARYHADGHIEYLGRLDRQTKMRGFRIELGEIEAALLEHPAVQEGVVMVREDFIDDKRLVAYVVLKQPTNTLRLFLKTKLPPHMLPSALVTLAHLPLTDHGKVDYSALPKPELLEPHEDFFAPQDGLELQLQKIWEDFLGVYPIGIKDNFFELGGHSLLAVRLLAQIGKIYQQQLPLSTFFQAPTIEQLATQLRVFSTTEPLSFIPHRPSTVPPLLSFAQQRLWFLEHLEPHTSLYHIPLAFKITGILHVDLLKKALEHVLSRHEVLRTIFEVVDEHPWQVVLPHRLIELPVIERVSPPEASWFSAEISRPFELSQEIPFRVTLFRLAHDHHFLLFVIHHIAFDGWSYNILLKEVMELYEAFLAHQSSPLLPLPLQYLDFAAWQHQQAKKLDASLSYWIGQLAHVNPLNFPTQQPWSKNYQGDKQTLVLPETLTRALRTLSLQEGVTLFMVLLSTFKLLLYRYTRQTDMVVGIPMATRHHAELENMIGLFLNTLAIRTHFSDELTFLHLLHQVQQTTLEAYLHQDFPFEKLVEELHPERNLYRHPLFDIMLNFMSIPRTPFKLPQAHIEPIELPTVTSKFLMTLYVEEQHQQLHLKLVYRQALLSQASMVHFLDQFQSLLEQILAHPQALIHSYSLVTPQARALLPDLNAVLSEPHYEPVPSLITTWAQCTPEHIAICQGMQVWTYAQLDFCARQVAQTLLAHGIQHGDVVALYGSRSFGMFSSMLGVWFSGGVLFMLTPHFPPQRRAAMLKESQTKIVLCIGESLEYTATLDVDPQTGQIHDVASLKDLSLPALNPEDPAYIFFTSGSTGVPKGILGSHKGLSHFLHWQRQTFAITPQDRCAQLTTLSFDVALRDILLPLSSGAKLCLPQHLGDELDPALIFPWLEQEQISLIHVVPSLVQTWLMNVPPEISLRHLRWIFFAGEPLKEKLVKTWRDTFPQAGEMINLYGPTETTLAKCYYRVPKELERGIQPVGVPLPHTQVLVLGENHQLCGIGEPGEILIRTPFRSFGYLNLPQENQQRFIQNPFRADPQDLLYRTGDWGRYLPQGTLELLGRLDHQVKIRGIRVELEEIEVLLTQHPEIENALVALWKSPDEEEQRLIAYIVAKHPPSSEELRNFMKQKLPDALLPSAWIILDHFPLNANGKLDRQALPPFEPGEEQEDFIAPRDELEEQLQKLWEEVLGVHPIGMKHNFFELGGHSLLVVRLLTRIGKTLGKKLFVSTLFQAPTIEQLALELRQQLGSYPLNIPRAPRGEAIPLSFAQQRLWFLEQFEPDTSLYHIARVFRIQGALNIEVLQQALEHIIIRHEVLRTQLIASEGQAIQVVNPVSWINLFVIDVLNSELEQHLQAEIERPFNLAQDPLLRAQLLRLAPTEYVLLLVTHHIASDGWSMGILLRELKILYRTLLVGQASSLPELPIQYADFSVWQRQWLSGSLLATQLNYWQQQLKGCPGLLNLPIKGSRPVFQTLSGAHQYFQIHASLLSELKQLTQHTETTLFMTLLAALMVLLSRYSGQKDMVVGSPIANRPHHELEGLIGFFVNTLVLRAQLFDNPPFRKFLSQVKQTCLDAYMHQDVPFEYLVEMLKPERNLSHSPLFQVMFVLQNVPTETLELTDLHVTPIRLQQDTAKFDLTLSIKETQEGLQGELEYNTDLFEETNMTRFIGHFQTLLQSIVTNPDQRFSELTFLTEEERHQLLHEWNLTTAHYPQDRCVHQLFEEQVNTTPQSTAVVYREHTITYFELNARANQLAHALRKLGIQTETLVGLCVERGLEMIIGILGILKAGGAYVPLEPTSPRERLVLMLQDSHPKLLLTQQKIVVSLPQTHLYLCLDTQWEQIAQESTENPPAHTQPQNLAYVIYTSGSTGLPKGVMIPHQALCNHLWWTCSHFPLTRIDKVLQHTPFSFDASICELFTPLLTGAQLVIAPPQIHQEAHALLSIIKTYGITTLQMVPSLLHTLIEEEEVEQLTSLKRIFCGGETLSETLLRKYFTQLDAELINMYGPTEACIDTTFWRCPRHAAQSPPPIGHPIANVQLYILDDALQLVPVGVPGELHISGVGLARGYLNRPELTAEKFIPHPFQPGSKMYKTGDLVRYLPKGQIEYLGRLDNQIKIRGYRIELGEIEAALMCHPHVKETVVITQENKSGELSLVAYVVLISPHTSPELRQFLKDKLPSVMIPLHFVVLEALPLTSHGKIDRRLLPPLERVEMSKSLTSPRDAIEEQLRNIWEEILNVHPIGIHHNFFELGGHSLLAVRLLAKLEKVFGQHLPVFVLFQFPTIEQLAHVLKRKVNLVSQALEIIQPHGHQWPLFFVGSTNYARALAPFLGAEQPIYGLNIFGLPCSTAMTNTLDVKDIAQQFIEHIQTIQPQGPYQLAGYCADAKIAFEMAKQFHLQGQQVLFLAFIDALWQKQNHYHRYWRNFLKFGLSYFIHSLVRKVKFWGLSLRLQFSQWSIQWFQFKNTPLPLTVQHLTFIREFFDALGNYTPEHYPGKITLFLSSEWYVEDLSEFAQLTGRGIEVYEIPGYHDELFTSPYVDILGTQLKQCLERTIEER